jgi:hypothetical protein
VNFRALLLGFQPNAAVKFEHEIRRILKIREPV